VNFRIHPALFTFDKRLFFLAIVLGKILMAVYVNNMLIDKNLFFETYSEQLAYERIEEMFNQREQWKWIAFLFIPVIFCIKFSLVAVALNVGILLNGLKTTFTDLFKIAMIAELVFLFGLFIKIIWMTFFMEIHSMTTIQTFNPLALINLINIEKLQSWMVYPLQALSVFELVYIFVLALGLSLKLQKSFLKMLVLVFSSYGLGFLLWLVVIMFISLNAG